MFYIVNETTKQVLHWVCERPKANYILTDSYAPDPHNRYSVMDEGEAFEYFKLCLEESGKAHEGTGISINMLSDMFQEWLLGE